MQNDSDTVSLKEPWILDANDGRLPVWVNRGVECINKECGGGRQERCEMKIELQWSW